MTASDPRSALETMLAHRSIRRFTNQPIPEEDIRRAFEAGQMASTSSNVQAYCAIRVNTPMIRESLAELAGPQQKVVDCGAFEAMGYGICYIGGLRNDLPQVDRLLNLPEGVYPLFGLCVGLPDEDPIPRPRVATGGVLFENTYPNDQRILEHIADYDALYEQYMHERSGRAASWSEMMASKYTNASRIDVGPYYRSKGADLS